ncbi:hypothetical protein AOL60_22065 [Salmonella enterica]|uniref:Tc1-like transposase DDE domain-containing protein n=2 Tax=Salmonella enterica TaxID=28901 RepID=A0A5U7IJV2_SALER|nr:hypothetical protein [Salmonella enterica]EAM3808979.1 hypothetical protein [Salmonella enterica subsp. enterica serovar Hartford]EAQ4367923.1 hypothetical protein [Salmonella enterica subsp. enterica]EBW5996901.1 hypothetical protein [Salmonella enterica subsp. enterica serovar Anatum]HCZ4781628.1 transposase [Salmonella enterica subsp. enterica serovar Saintpaul str. CFSAN004131]
MILDGAGYHRTEQVKEWAFMLNIELYYLPPYSPNLNPIERLWKAMNEKVINNRYFTSPKVFRGKYSASPMSYYRNLPGCWRAALMTASRR